MWIKVHIHTRFWRLLHIIIRTQSVSQNSTITSETKKTIPCSCRLFFSLKWYDKKPSTAWTHILSEGYKVDWTSLAKVFVNIWIENLCDAKSTAYYWTPVWNKNEMKKTLAIPSPLQTSRNSPLSRNPLPSLSHLVFISYFHTILFRPFFFFSFSVPLEPLFAFGLVHHIVNS